MKNPVNDPNQKETMIKTPDPNKEKQSNNPKLPDNDADQTPDKEVENVPVANPDKDSDLNHPKRKKIGFNLD